MCCVLSEDSEEPSAHVTCPVKTMIKASGTPVRNTTGNTYFQCHSNECCCVTVNYTTFPFLQYINNRIVCVCFVTGLITPTFGVVSNCTPLGPALDRPMPRPHPEDEASLVQMAEHIPAGTRTPMCAHCHMVIRYTHVNPIPQCTDTNYKTIPTELPLH